MRCAEFVELASEYLDGALEADVTGRVTAHLECPGCAVYLEQLRRTVELLGGLSDRAWRSAAGPGWRRS